MPAQARGGAAVAQEVKLQRCHQGREPLTTLPDGGGYHGVGVKLGKK